MNAMNHPVTGAAGKQYLLRHANQFDALLQRGLEKYKEEALQISESADLLFSRLAHMSDGGKKLRGALMVLGHELSGSTSDLDVAQLSVFMELFHTGLLIHDDIMDRDDTRRGEDSLHVQFATIGRELEIADSDNYGIAMAIAAGDLAFYLSWRILLESDFPETHIREVSKVYSRYAMRLVYGQAMDLSQLPLTKTNSERILRTMRYKTAEYTGVLPLEIGAVMGGMDDLRREKLRKYGLALGWAFQVQDDVLGLFGEEESLGKPIGSDIREGKNTLLMLKLHEMGTAAQKKKQQELLGSQNVGVIEVEEMRGLLRDSGAYDAVLELGNQYVSDAHHWADSLQATPTQTTLLKSLATYMMERVQ